MDDEGAGRGPTRRQALVTAGLAAVAVPPFRPRPTRTPRPAPSGTPSPEPAPVQPAADPASAPPYITGLAGTTGAGYFIDQYNNPRLWVATET